MNSLCLYLKPLDFLPLSLQTVSGYPISLTPQPWTEALSRARSLFFLLSKTEFSSQKTGNHQTKSMTTLLQFITSCYFCISPVLAGHQEASSFSPLQHCDHCPRLYLRMVPTLASPQWGCCLPNFSPLPSLTCFPLLSLHSHGRMCARVPWLWTFYGEGGQAAGTWRKHEQSWFLDGSKLRMDPNPTLFERVTVYMN